MTLARKYGEEIRFFFQEKSEKGKQGTVFQLSSTFKTISTFLLIPFMYYTNCCIEKKNCNVNVAVCIWVTFVYVTSVKVLEDGFNVAPQLVLPSYQQCQQSDSQFCTPT